MLIISEPNSCWVPTLWLLWSNQHTYCFRCVVCNVTRFSICTTYLQKCLKSSYRGCKYQNIISITQWIYPGTSYIAPYTSCTEVRVKVISVQLCSNCDNWPPCLIPFEQRNVIDNELPRRTINSCSLYLKINNFTICNGTFLSNSFFASVQWLTLSNAFLDQERKCIRVCPEYGKKTTVCLCANMAISVPCACSKTNWLLRIPAFRVAAARPAQLPWWEWQLQLVCNY